MSFFFLSGFSDECAFSAADQLAGLQRLGIGATELRSLGGKNIADLSLQEVKDFAKLSESCGIIVNAVGSPLGKIPLSGDRESHQELAKKIFEYAQILKTEFVRMFSFYIPEGMKRAECFEETTEAVGKLLDLSRSFGLTLCHENEAGIYGESPEDCRRLLDALPELSCVFDMGNFTLSSYDPLRAYALLRDRIRYFHIKDGTKAGQIVPPGEGEAEIGTILQRYRREIGRPTFITLEPHLTEFTGLSGLTKEKHALTHHFENDTEAFSYACTSLKRILEEIEE